MSNTRSGIKKDEIHFFIILIAVNKLSMAKTVAIYCVFTVIVNSKSKMYDNNGKYWIYTVLSNFYYILSGILFEDNSTLIKDVYCKLMACAHKKN